MTIVMNLWSLKLVYMIIFSTPDVRSIFVPNGQCHVGHRKCVSVCCGLNMAFRTITRKLLGDNIIARTNSQPQTANSCTIITSVFCYYAALLPRRGPHIASHSVCLSVRLSVCLSVRPVRGSSFVILQ